MTEITNDVEIIDGDSYTNTIIYILASTLFLYIFYKFSKSFSLR